MTDAEIRDRLEEFLRKRCGEVRVSELESLAGGASRKLFGFRLRRSDDAAPEHLVLRMDPPGGRLESDLSAEFDVLSAAAAGGVTVPSVHWAGAAGDGLGAAFIIMDRVRGEAIARRLLREEAFAQARAALPAQLAGELARIHACDVAETRLAEPAGDRRRYALAEIEKYRTLLALADGDHPRPAIVFGARWLVRHAPSVEQPCLVHGDFRIGNVMYDEQGLTAVLDWELSHLGDPLEDLGWLTVRAWRFGADDRPVGGLCSRERLLELYEEASGRAVDPRAVAYWEIFGNWRWAVICVLQASGYRAGPYPNVELASLGRRVAEVECEMLTLIADAQAVPATHAAQATQVAQVTNEREDD